MYHNLKNHIISKGPNIPSNYYKKFQMAYHIACYVFLNLQLSYIKCKNWWFTIGRDRTTSNYCEPDLFNKKDIEWILLMSKRLSQNGQSTLISNPIFVRFSLVRIIPLYEFLCKEFNFRDKIQFSNMIYFFTLGLGGIGHYLSKWQINWNFTLYVIIFWILLTRMRMLIILKNVFRQKTMFLFQVLVLTMK